MNKVLLSGRLTAAPEVRYTQNGKAVTSFSVAVNRRVNGENQADFIPVVVWDKLAEICGNNLAKGRRVLVEGRLQIRSYETDAAERRRLAEVVASNVEFLDKLLENSQKPSDPLAGFGQEIEYDMKNLPF